LKERLFFMRERGIGYMAIETRPANGRFKPREIKITKSGARL